MNRSCELACLSGYCTGKNVLRDVYEIRLMDMCIKGDEVVGIVE